MDLVEKSVERYIFTKLLRSAVNLGIIDDRDLIDFVVDRTSQRQVEQMLEDLTVNSSVRPIWVQARQALRWLEARFLRPELQELEGGKAAQWCHEALTAARICAYQNGRLYGRRWVPGVDTEVSDEQSS